MVRKTKAEKAAEAKYAAWLERRAIRPPRRMMVWRGQIITRRPLIAYVGKAGMVYRRRAKSATPLRELEMRRNSTRSTRRRNTRKVGV